MVIPKALLLPLAFNPAELRADLDSVLSQRQWVPHFNTRYYEGDWSVLSLRSTNGDASQIYPDPTVTEFRDTPLLDACPAHRRALAAFQCPLLGARLLRLAAGSEIREHRDYKLGYEDGEVRVHVPVQTNPQVEFYLDGERIPLGEGECWYLNLNLKHRVRNHGVSDRIHLVVDCVMNDWMRLLIEEAAQRSVPA